MYKFVVLAVLLSVQIGMSHVLPGKVRIFGGDEVKLGQFPWHALIANKNDLFQGSLVDQQWVLTSANAVEGEVKDLEVGLGSNYAGSLIVYKVSNVHVNNGLALVRLTRPVDHSENIKPVTLATSKDLVSENQRVTVTAFQTGFTSTFPLKYLEQTTITNEKCAQSYDVVHDDIVCAVAKTNACMDDIGSPLVVEDSEFVQVGVMSFTDLKKCSTDNFPTAYIRVAHHIQWIQETIAGKF